MPFLDAMIAQLVDNAKLTSRERTVEGMFAALFHGSDADPNLNGVGGLAGLVMRFENAGLGDIVHSWTGPGPNRPVTTQQLRAVLGDDAIHKIATASAAEDRDILGELALLLPGVVRRISHGTK